MSALLHRPGGFAARRARWVIVALGGDRGRPPLIVLLFAFRTFSLFIISRHLRLLEEGAGPIDSGPRCRLHPP